MPAMRLWVALAIGWALAAPALKADALDTLQRRLAMAAEPRILFVGNSYSFKVPGALKIYKSLSKIDPEIDTILNTLEIGHMLPQGSHLGPCLA